jgi:hydroxymethylpyrimidine pyrophosphatase-like HAD family hydrolase
VSTLCACFLSHWQGSFRFHDDMWICVDYAWYISKQIQCYTQNQLHNNFINIANNHSSRNIALMNYNALDVKYQKSRSISFWRTKRQCDQHLNPKINQNKSLDLFLSIVLHLQIVTKIRKMPVILPQHWVGQYWQHKTSGAQNLVIYKATHWLCALEL